MNKKRRFLFIWLVLLIALSPSSSAKAQSQITFGKTTVENHFPDSLTFRVSVSSTEGEIVSAKLYYSFSVNISTESTYRFEVEVEPGRQVDLEYIWDTSQLTSVPSTPINFYWEVTDSAGNRTRSGKMFVRYDDNRFNWQKLESENIRIWWHDKPGSFGQDVMDIAEQAIKAQRRLFGADLEFPMMIIVYNDLDEFNDWHAIPLGWVGGQAYPNFGITTQIVTSRSASKVWLNDVVPHEISHLYFAQVTYNPTAPTPAWLDEGVAQYNEFNDHSWGVSLAQAAAVSEVLLPLSVLEDGFGSYNEERIYLSYNEALNAVVYMVETYGEGGLADLLAAYKSGLHTDEAFPAAFGVSMGQFESDWSVWLGAPEGSLVTPTPWPFPTFRPSPTMMVLGGGSGSDPATQPAPTTAAEAEATNTPEAAPLPQEKEQSPEGGFLPGCFSAIYAMVGAVGMRLHRRKRWGLVKESRNR